MGAKEHCNVEEEVTAVANGDVIEKLKECKEANDKCMGAAASLKDKAECYMTYGVCIGKDLAICAGPCLPSSAMCMMGAVGNYKKMIMCGMQFVNCARKECMKSNIEEEDSYAPFALAVQSAHLGQTDNGIIDVVKECQASERQCVSEAKNPMEKAKCFLKFGLCVAKGFKGCTKCFPSVAMCLMTARGKPMAVLKCAMDFVECAKESCVYEETTAVSNGDIIEKWKSAKMPTTNVW